MELNLCDGAAPIDVLDLWTSNAATAMDSVTGDISFDVPTTPVPVLWQVNLPTDPVLAATRLGASENSLRRSQQLLTVAASRLEQLEPLGPVSFTAGAETMMDLPRPERELLALLQGEAQPVSFSVDDNLAVSGLGWEQAQQVFQTLIDKLRQSVAECVSIETRIAGRLLAHTSVNWSGDVQTVWPGSNSVEEVMLHQRTVALALKSRETMLKMFTATVQMAISLSLRLSLPGGPLLVLPAVLRFIKQMLELQNSPQNI